MEYRLVNVFSLRETEQINTSLLEIMLEGLGKNLSEWPPILLEERSQYILDGHHRVRLAKILNQTKIKACLVSYEDDRIKVFDYESGESLNKNDLLKRYKTGVKLPPKSTRHIVDQE